MTDMLLEFRAAQVKQYESTVQQLQQSNDISELKSTMNGIVLALQPLQVAPTAPAPVAQQPALTAPAPVAQQPAPDAPAPAELTEPTASPAPDTTAPVDVAPVAEPPFVAGAIPVPAARRRSILWEATADVVPVPEKRRDLVRSNTDEEDAAFLKKRSLDWEEPVQVATDPAMLATAGAGSDDSTL